MKKLFTLIAIAMVATCAMAGNHVVKLTHAAAKANTWDTQIFFKVENLEPNKVYKVYFDVKASEPVTISTEEIDDVQSEHKDPYGGSAIFNYSENVDVTTEWTTGCATFKGICKSDCKTEGHETHENFEFAATAILLGVGKVPGEIWFDNIVVTDEDGNEVYKNDFENGARVAAYDTSADGHYPGWQLDNGKGMWEIEEEADHVIEDYMVKVDVTEAKANMWDSQIMVNIPTLEVGKHYGIVASFRSSEPEVEIQCVIEDNASENRDQYGNSADLAYSANFKVTDTWSQSEAIWSYQDENENWHYGTDGKFPYNRIIFQLGHISGTLYIDNLKIFEISEEGGKQVIDFKEGITGIAEKRGYHDHVTIGKAESDVPEFDDPVYEVPTAISNVAVDSAKAQKALKNGQIVITRGAKAYNAVGQEL